MYLPHKCDSLQTRVAAHKKPASVAQAGLWTEAKSKAIPFMSLHKCTLYNALWKVSGLQLYHTQQWIILILSTKNGSTCQDSVFYIVKEAQSSSL